MAIVNLISLIGIEYVSIQKESDRMALYGSKS